MNSAMALIACATCFGAPDSSMTQGMNMAIITLLGVTGAVLGGFIATIVYFIRRARRYEAMEQAIPQSPNAVSEPG